MLGLVSSQQVSSQLENQEITSTPPPLSTQPPSSALGLTPRAVLLIAPSWHRLPLQQQLQAAVATGLQPAVWGLGSDPPALTV